MSDQVVINTANGSVKRFANINVNISVDIIFSIYHPITSAGSLVTEDDFLQSGSGQAVAGYVVYSLSTMPLYTTSYGVHIFIYDPSLGVFCLSHEKVHFPETGNMYFINKGNYIKFSRGVKIY